MESDGGLRVSSPKLSSMSKSVRRGVVTSKEINGGGEGGPMARGSRVNIIGRRRTKLSAAARSDVSKQPLQA